MHSRLVLSPELHPYPFAGRNFNVGVYLQAVDNAAIVSGCGGCAVPSNPAAKRSPRAAQPRGSAADKRRLWRHAAYRRRRAGAQGLCASSTAGAARGTARSLAARPHRRPAAQTVATQGDGEPKIDATGKCELVVAIGSLSMHFSNRPFLLHVAPRDARGAGLGACTAPSSPPAHPAARRRAAMRVRCGDGGRRILPAPPCRVRPIPGRCPAPRRLLLHP